MNVHESSHAIETEFELLRTELCTYFNSKREIFQNIIQSSQKETFIQGNKTENDISSTSVNTNADITKLLKSVCTDFSTKNSGVENESYCRVYKETPRHQSIVNNAHLHYQMSSHKRYMKLRQLLCSTSSTPNYRYPSKIVSDRQYLRKYWILWLLHKMVRKKYRYFYIRWKLLVAQKYWSIWYTKWNYQKKNRQCVSKIVVVRLHGQKMRCFRAWRDFISTNKRVQDHFFYMWKNYLQMKRICRANRSTCMIYMHCQRKKKGIWSWRAYYTMKKHKNTIFQYLKQIQLERIWGNWHYAFNVRMKWSVVMYTISSHYQRGMVKRIWMIWVDYLNNIKEEEEIILWFQRRVLRSVISKLLINSHTMSQNRRYSFVAKRHHNKVLKGHYIRRWALVKVISKRTKDEFAKFRKRMVTRHCFNIMANLHTKSHNASQTILAKRIRLKLRQWIYNFRRQKQLAQKIVSVVNLRRSLLLHVLTWKMWKALYQIAKKGDELALHILKRNISLILWKWHSFANCNSRSRRLETMIFNFRTRRAWSLSVRLLYYNAYHRISDSQSCDIGEVFYQSRQIHRAITSWYACIFQTCQLGNFSTTIINRKKRLAIVQWRLALKIRKQQLKKLYVIITKRRDRIIKCMVYKKWVHAARCTQYERLKIAWDVWLLWLHRLKRYKGIWVVAQNLNLRRFWGRWLSFIQIQVQTTLNVKQLQNEYNKKQLQRAFSYIWYSKFKKISKAKLLLARFKSKVYLITALTCWSKFTQRKKLESRVLIMYQQTLVRRIWHWLYIGTIINQRACQDKLAQFAVCKYWRKWICLHNAKKLHNLANKRGQQFNLRRCVKHWNYFYRKQRALNYYSNLAMMVNMVYHKRKRFKLWNLFTINHKRAREHQSTLAIKIRAKFFLLWHKKKICNQLIKSITKIHGTHIIRRTWVVWHSSYHKKRMKFQKLLHIFNKIRLSIFLLEWKDHVQIYVPKKRKLVLQFTNEKNHRLQRHIWRLWYNEMIVERLVCHQRHHTQYQYMRKYFTFWKLKHQQYRNQ